MLRDSADTDLDTLFLLASFYSAERSYACYQRREGITVLPLRILRATIMGAVVVQMPCTYTCSNNLFLVGSKSATQDGAHTLHHYQGQEPVARWVITMNTEIQN